MMKNRSGRFSIPWLYIIAANAVLVDILLAWMFLNGSIVSDTRSNGIDHRSLGSASLKSRGFPGPGFKYVGFMILGANRSIYQKSMDQRIQHAFDKWITTCNKSGYQGVFFPTGRNSTTKPEAQYIQDQILEKYEAISGLPKYKNLRTPIIHQEGAALFTVDNFLKTVPKVNRYQQYHGINFKVVYLITNEYHMGRAMVILKKFQDQQLVDFPVERCEVPKTVCDADKDDKLTQLAPSGMTFETQVRNDTGRDITNSGCFARAIFMKVHDWTLPSDLIAKTYLCDQLQYAKANCGDLKHKDVSSKLKQFDSLVSAFVNAAKTTHQTKCDADTFNNVITSTGCNSKMSSIMEDKYNILKLLNELKEERGPLGYWDSLAELLVMW